MPTVRTKHGVLEFVDPPWVPTLEEVEAYQRTHPEDGPGRDLFLRLIRAHRMRVEQIMATTDALAAVADRSARRRAIALAALAAADLDLAVLPEEHRKDLEADDLEGTFPYASALNSEGSN